MSDDNNGFTIMELMIVICLIGVLAGVVGPGLLKDLPNRRLKAAAIDLQSAFHRMKLEAVKQNENIMMLFSPAAYTSSGGVGGYELFVDDGTGGGTAENRIRDGNEPILLTAAMPKGVSLIGASFRTGGANPPSQTAGFNGRGLPAGSYIGDVQLRTDNRWYRITLTIAGHVTIEKSGDGLTWSN